MRVLQVDLPGLRASMDPTARRIEVGSGCNLIPGAHDHRRCHGSRYDASGANRVCFAQVQWTGNEVGGN